MNISKSKKNTYEKSKAGAWVTKQKMISAAWAWAANTKNLRRNGIHGEEEARLVLDDKFEAADMTAQELEMRGKFRTEIFQVKYRKQDGQLSHLLGLRDFTDQDALTGQKADIDQGDNFAKIRSRRSNQSQPATGGGVIFLELDLERQVVDAASILASGLVGMSLPELFPGAGWEAIENFGGDVMQKWKAQDISSLARKVHRFERLLMQFPPSQSESIDGTIEVLLSERSSVSAPRLLLRCVGSTVLTSASASSRSIRDRRGGADSSKQSGISSASHLSEKSNASKSSESRDWFGPVVPGKLGSSLLS
ncbi:unnamed protein product [Symbiodinium sp. CCMP2456]|nr:unnamed protein product [Symbiodinium sp. CCMP2456]